MPDPTTRTTPKGQAKGQAGQQQQFLSATAPAPAPAVGESIEPENPGLVDDEFGDFSEMLFAPSQQPAAGGVPMPTRSADLAPNAAVFRLLQDPRLSEDFKGMIQLSVLNNILTRATRIDSE